MSTSASEEPELFFPQLHKIYESLSNLWYPLIRVTIGAILFVHGLGKVHVGVGYVAENFAKNGFVHSAAAFAYITMFLETIGALCIMLGLFTRLFAAIITIGLVIVLIIAHLPNGFAVLNNGFEYVLLEAVVMFAIALRGGGPYSIDRLVGRQL